MAVYYTKICMNLYWCLQKVAPLQIQLIEKVNTIAIYSFSCHNGEIIKELG